MKMRDDPKFEKYRVNCLICNDGFEWQYLGSHVSHKHKISAKKYKEMFGLPHNLSLFNDEVKEKKQKAFNQHRKKYLKNILNQKGNRFIKGNCGRNRGYISKLEKKNLINTRWIYGRKCDTIKMLKWWLYLIIFGMMVLMFYLGFTQGYQIGWGKGIESQNCGLAYDIVSNQIYQRINYYIYYGNR